MQVILMIHGAIGLTDQSNRSRAQMGRVLSAWVVLESLVMRDVVDLGDEHAGCRGMRLAATGRLAQTMEVEAAREVAPGHSGGVQQVAHILSRHRKIVAARADVARRLAVVDN